METWLFSTQWSPWILAGCFILAAALSYAVYRRTVPALPWQWRLGLGILRTLALTLLLMLLAEPLLSLVRTVDIPPRIAVLLDNSISAGITDARVDRRKQYQQVLTALQQQLGAEQTLYWRFDVHPTVLPTATFDSLSFKGELTNIAAALTTAAPDIERQNIRAFVLVSDGNANTGENPLYPAERLARPVYPIVIGDTATPRDIQLRSIATNDIAYVRTTVPVHAIIQATGIPARTIAVRLFEDGKQIDQQELQIHPQQQSYTVRFAYTPQQPGTHTLQVAVDTVDHELTPINNQQTAFIKVLESKRTIVLIAGAPYPDVSFIRNALQYHPDIEVRSFTQKKYGKGFFEGPLTDAVLQKAELIVLVGFPTAETPVTILHQIRSALQRHKPLLFVASRILDYSKLKLLDLFLPFRIQRSSNQELVVFPAVPPEAMYHPLMKLSGDPNDVRWWNQLPPIFRTEIFALPKPGAQVLAKIKIGQRTFDDPLIIAQSFQQYRSVAVLGYHLYRWKLLGYAAERAKGRPVPDVFSRFFQNALQWLTATQVDKLVRIHTNKKLYAQGETVDFIAQIYDEALNPINDARVEVHLQSAAEKRTIPLLPLGAGRYIAHVKGLPAGTYRFTGTAFVGGRQYGTDQGRFRIGSQSIEYLDIRANLRLLQTLAERTGGTVFFPYALDTLAAAIHRHPQFQKRSVTTAQTLPLWQNLWFIVLIITLFAIEWFFRKQKGLL